MAIALISAAFKAAVSPTEKLVLLALADSANDDDGGCFFLVSTLCRKTSLSERTIQGVFNRLSQAGYLKREFRPGRSTVFFLSLQKLGVQSSYPHPRSSCTPAKSAVTPAAAAPTPAAAAPTPAAPAPISVSYPGSYPLTNPKEPDALKSASPESEPELPPEVRAANLAKLRALVGLPPRQ